MDSIIFNSSHAAEQAFYRAFSRGDLPTMQQVWQAGDDVTCIHPMGDRHVGLQEVLRSWEHILKNTADVIIELTNLDVRIIGITAVHTLTENIRVIDKPAQVFRFVTTNIYQQTGSGWKMILHHASPAPKDLSSQEAVPGRIH